MAWWDHEELKSREYRSDKYKLSFPEYYSPKEVKEAHESYNTHRKDINEMINEIEEIESDFGFTTISDVEVKLESKSQKIYDTIIPLLNNLKKNPENEMIKWPKRDLEINKFINKLNEILNS